MNLPFLTPLPPATSPDTPLTGDSHTPQCTDLLRTDLTDCHGSQCSGLLQFSPTLLPSRHTPVIDNPRQGKPITNPWRESLPHGAIKNGGVLRPHNTHASFHSRIASTTSNQSRRALPPSRNTSSLAFPLRSLLSLPSVHGPTHDVAALLRWYIGKVNKKTLFFILFFNGRYRTPSLFEIAASQEVVVPTTRILASWLQHSKISAPTVDRRVLWAACPLFR